MDVLKTIDSTTVIGTGLIETSIGTQTDVRNRRILDWKALASTTWISQTGRLDFL